MLDELAATHPRPLTNAQLAARCDVSERTVQRHMRECFREGKVSPVWVHWAQAINRVRGWSLVREGRDIQ